MFDPVWEQIHASRTWGRYPKEELVRWVARNYFSTNERAAIRFLDLGCGAGSSSWFLQQEGFSVVPLDGSATAVQRAGGGVVADAMNLPFRDGVFDAIIDVVCVAHNDTDDAQVIISEMARVLKPGGKLFSVLPSTESHPDPYMNKGAIKFFDYFNAWALYQQHFEDIKIDSTLSSEDGKYTKLWFVKAKSKEITNG